MQIKSKQFIFFTMSIKKIKTQMILQVRIFRISTKRILNEKEIKRHDSIIHVK